MKMIEILEKCCSVNIITHWRSVDFHLGIMVRDRIINLGYVLCVMKKVKLGGRPRRLVQL